MELVGRRGRLAAAALVGVLLLSAGVGAAVQTNGFTGVFARNIVPPGEDQKSRKPQPIATPIAVAAAPTVTPEGPPSFARVAPHVESLEPSSNKAPVNAEIVVIFSQPMAPASVERSFSIRPSLEGQSSWSDVFTFHFQPFQLAHGAAYEVQVGGRSDRGVPLTGQRVWHFSTVAAPPLVLAPGPATVKVPILTYHYIRVNPDPNDRLGFALSVTPADFAAQMDWLASNGFHPVTPSDVYAYLNGTQGLPSRPVILSFDDGYADFYTTALPILRAHDFTAVAYIVSGFVGQWSYMTAAQIVEIDRRGIEIGSHTVHHANLAKAAPGNVQVELVASKQALEQLIGHPVYSFCYPSGQYNGAVAAAVQAAGYSNATTTAFGYVHYMSDRYRWTRLRISGGEALSDFGAALLAAS
ncbi:MAG TPA: polysaccharide deacetylase family protein [Candidatus Dormibacteraeota bacterium]|nr:polysaccharide deacetylase family protein [Candidatus Dormibacteraeota bacterium]